MRKLNALDYLAGVESSEKSQASAPTNLHVITGEVTSKSEEGVAKVALDGTVYSEDEAQSISIEALGGLEQGDTVTILLAGESGHGMTPLALGSVGSIDRIVTNVSEIQADYVKATELEADVAELGYAHITDGVIDNATIDVADVNNLSANYASIGQLEAAEGRIGTLETTSLTADSATIKNLEADTAKVHSLSADELSAATGYVKDLKAGNVTAQSIIADHGDFDTVKANAAKVANLTAQELEADHAKVSRLDADQIAADHAVIDSLDANYASVQSLEAANGRIDSLESSKADIEDLEANYAHITKGVIDNAKIGYADINGLSANYAQIDMANVNNGWITNGTIKNAAIKSEMVESISANQLTAGTIDADEITVQNLKASSLTVQTADGYVYVGEKRIPTKEFIDSLRDELQDEIDGAIETFTVSAVPTLNNTPASSWVVSGDSEATKKLRMKHVGDIAYVLNSSLAQNGYCYRFAYDSSSQSFKWVLIKDSDVTAALSRLTTAEGKITGLETFESDTTSWIEETDEGLKTIRQNHTALSGKVDKTVVETKQLWFTKANTTAPNKPTAEVTSTSTAGNAWRVVVPAYSTSYPNYYYCLQYKLADGTFAWSDVVRDIAMGESQQQGRKGVADAATADGKAVSAQNTANANIKSSVQLWFTKANTTAPSKPSGTNPITVNDASKTNQWNLAIPTYNSSYPNYFYCYQQQKGDGTYQWSDVVYDRSITEAQAKAQASLPSSTFETFKSTTFKEVVDEVDEQSTTINNLSTAVSKKADSSTVTTISNTVNEVKQTANSNKSYITNLTTTLGVNSDGTSKSEDIVHKYNELDQTLDGTISRVGKTESALETISNPNLSPFFSMTKDNVYNASSNPDGYWGTNAPNLYCTNLSDGWTHFVCTNNGSGTFWLTIYEHSEWRHAHGDLKGDTTYTVLMEFRNVTKSGNVTSAGISSHSSSWPSMFSETPARQEITEGASLYFKAKTVADPASVTGQTCSTRTLVALPAGSSLTCDMRVSLYEGDYSGPYKPYVDQTLTERVRQAETSIEQNAEAITLRATKSEAYQSAQPNLHPVFSYAPFPTSFIADSSANGYWKYWAGVNDSITKLDDGWAHYNYTNTDSSVKRVEFAVEASEAILPATDYTILVEVRNVSVSVNTDFYLVQSNDAQFWGGGVKKILEDQSNRPNESKFCLRPEMSGVSGTLVKRYVKTSELANSTHITGNNFDNAYKMFMYTANVGSGQSASFDARISIYPGEYTGPYKPYSGTQLYASQSELKVANDAISARVEKDGVIAAINASVESEGGSLVKISANKVNIEGAAIFSSGRLSQTSLNNAFVSEKTISTATDFDTLTDSGVYYIKNSSCANAPTTNLGKLDVAISGKVVQWFYPDALPYSYYRARTGNTWSAWSKVDGVGAAASVQTNLDNLNRTCVVGQASTAKTNQWYKVASTSITTQHVDNVVLFDVSNCGGFNVNDGYGRNQSGRLTAHIRANGGIRNVEHPYLVWESRGSQIVLSDFVLAYKVTSGTRIDAEVWCRCPYSYHGYRFEVVYEGNRGNKVVPGLWTLYDAWTAGGQASITSGYTQVVSTDGNSAQLIANTAIKRRQRIYYRSSSSAKPTAMPTAWVTEAGDKWAANNTTASNWTTKVTPISNGTGASVTKYLYLWTCEQYQLAAADAMIQYTEVLLDDTTTTIDGGTVITGSLKANSVDATSGTFDVANIPELTADHIKAKVIDAVNNGTGTINADKINVAGISIGQSQVTGLTTDLGNKASSEDLKKVSGSVTWMGTSGTAADTAAKVVTCDGFTSTDLKAGATICVRFANPSTVVGALTLNVNGTGAKGISASSGVTSATNLLHWSTGSTITFYYNGTYWRVADTPPAYYGTCATAAGTAAKSASVSGAVVFAGTTVHLNMTNANTSTSATLSTGGVARAIYYGTTSTRPTTANGYGWKAGTTASFVFDGQFWRYADASSMYQSDAAAKTATNFLTDINSTGLMVHPTNDANTGVRITSDVDIVRAGNVRTRVDANGMTLYDGSGTADSNVVAKFASNAIELGKNSSNAVIKMCGDTAEIKADSDRGHTVLAGDSIGLASETGSRIGMTLSGSVAEISVNKKLGVPVSFKVRANYGATNLAAIEAEADYLLLGETEQSPTAYSMADIITALTAITTGTLSESRIPSLAASKINSGTFDAARIPSLAASKITSGTFSKDRIPNIAELNRVYAGSTVVTLSNGQWLQVASASTVTDNLGSGASQANTICIAQNGDFNTYAGVVTGAMGQDGSARAYVYPNRTGSIRINYLLIRFA